MAAKYKRHLKKEVDAWKAELPDELQFISAFDYFAVAEQRVDGVRGWCVEIPSYALKALLDAKNKLKAARLANRQMKSDIQELNSRNATLKSRLDRESEANRHLKDTVGKMTEVAAVAAADEATNLKQIEDLEWELNTLKEELEPLRIANQQLLANMKDDGKPERRMKGPKNFFEKVAEDPTKTPRGLPLPHAYAPKNK